MTAKTYQIPVHGVFDTNCFLHVDEKSGHCFIIDPGAEAERLLTIIHKHGLTVERVLLTHGHFDHFGAARELCDALSIPLEIHTRGEAYLQSPVLNLSGHFSPMVFEGATFFEEGEVLSLEANPDVRLRVMHTPGHTPDSVVLHDGAASKAFVGDTIFQGGIGTWEYPGGSRRDLVESIYRILELPGETTLLSGHSNPWTVEEARTQLLS